MKVSSGDVLCQPQAKILFGEGGGGKGEQPETEVAGWRRYSMLRWRERRTATCGLCKRAACCQRGNLAVALQRCVLCGATGLAEARSSRQEAAATRLAALGPDGPLVTARPRSALSAVKVALRAGCPEQSQRPGRGPARRRPSAG
jgi:hypothetical protein